MENRFKASSRLVFYIFLFLFFGTGIFARWNIIKAPITQLKYNVYIKPHLNSSTTEILLSKHHRQIQIYKNAFSNILYKKFGINEITFRAFSTIVSLLTIFFIFLFTQKTIGRIEALIAALLFGVSYYSFITIKNPYYGAFNMLGSFLSFYFLFKGLEENKHIDWLLLGICSFLSITNVFLAGITLPVLFVVTVIYLFRKWKFQFFSILELKSRFYRFLIYLGLSTVAALCLYQIRGLDLFGAFWDIVVTHKVDPKVNADTILVETSFYSGLIRLLYTVFVTFNFEHGDGSEYILGVPEGPWVYFILFLIGLWSLYKSHREWFWRFLGIFLTPVIISGMILRISEARFLALIHPFYLITVGIGFIYFFGWLKSFFKSEPIRNSIVLLCGYLVFVGLVHPKPLWGTPVYDELFKTKGIRAIRDYLRTHIKENDILLNSSPKIELLGDVGNAFNLSTYAMYLNEFTSNHRLELLPLRTGKVGVWLILMKPLRDNKIVPFYFPKTYSPKIALKLNGHFLYYGEINIPKVKSIKEDVLFTTPFWSFLKGLELQKIQKFNEAKSYYELAIKHGFNLERLYYNYSILFFNSSDYVSAFSYMEKAIGFIETPTIVPENIKINSWQTYGNDERGLPDVTNRLTRLRHIYLKKNGIKYKKWFLEDFIEIKPSSYAIYYFNAMSYARALYLQTKKEIYLKKIDDFYKRGSKLARGKQIEWFENNYKAKDRVVLYSHLWGLLGITELYPPIKRD